MAVLPTGIGPVTGYNIERSLRFNSADSAYLNRTPGSTGNRRTFTFSFWIKRSTLGTGQRIFQSQDDGTVVANTLFILFSADYLEIGDYSSGYRLNLRTAQVFRDPSAWYHVVIAIDTTQATASNRAKIYVNGSQVTTLAAATYPSQNTDLFWNVSGQPCFIGRFFDGASALAYLNAYLTEVHFINGYPTVGSTTYNATTWASLDVSTLFGETDASTGVWKPKKYDGTYGTNGFYLKFADNSNTTAATLGKDSSGNGNNWTPNNFSVTAGSGNDSLVDSPTSYGGDTGAGGEVRGNYCTLNGASIGANATLSNGNLDISYGSSATRNATMGTFGMSSGKWYWETTIVSLGTPSIGITNTPSSSDVSNYPGFAANGWSYISDGTKYHNLTGVAYGATYTTNDVIGVAFDADIRELTFYKNGVSQGVAYTGLAVNTYFPAFGDGSAAGTWSGSTNFGQRPFQKWNGSAYVANTAPSGFKALCTQNLTTPTIGATSTTQANDYFNVVLYTGNGSSQTVTGFGFDPDMVWHKGRSVAYSHSIVDVIRGNNNVIFTNTTDAEQNPGAQLALATDGATVTYRAANLANNQNAATYVIWGWKANGAGSSNTAGNITSTVSANNDSGFSIVTYTGNGSANQTVGHGCKVGGVATAPSMVVVKNRSSGVTGWAVWHTGIGATDYLLLNLTNQKATSSTVFSAAPTSSVFSIGTDSTVNGNTNSLVAYCFAPVANYSAFGSYTGNGAADGPFVYTGFRPRYVLIKKTATGAGNAEWYVHDTARDDYNQARVKLYPSSAVAENGVATETTTTNAIDILSNGFKLRTGNGATNESAIVYIYAAFAESPFKYSLAR